MISYIQVLGAGTLDGGHGLLLFFDNRRYLFNCSEGTQRFCTNHKIKLSKLSSIFLTRLEWDRTGGIPGMICTLADGGVGELKFVGPRNTSHFVGSLRAFVKRSSLQISIKEVDEHQDFITIFKDDLITVKCVPLSPLPAGVKRLKTPPLTKDSTNLNVENLHLESSPSATSNDEYLLKMFKGPFSYNQSATSEECSSSFDKMPSVARKNLSLCYVVEGPTIPGKFDVKRAKELGIPVGPLFGKLMKNETITLDDGRTISPEECVGPSTPGPKILIVDIYTEEQLQNLIEKLNLFTVDDRISMVFHFCDALVWSSNEYQTEVVKKFSPSSVKHVWIPRTNYRMVYPAPANILRSLSENLDSSIFNIPVNQSSLAEEAASPLLKFHWYSTNKKDESIDRSDSTELSNETHPFSHIQKSYSPTKDNPIVTFLGTGAALPGKYRNVSSALIDFGGESYLFDCGEATTGQIFRCFGSGLATSIIKRLSAIFISHLHADHQVGVPGVIFRLKDIERGEKLSIVAPKRYSLFLQEFGECADLGGTFNFIPTEQHLDFDLPIGLKKILAVPVIHCIASFGYVIEHQSGIKLAYSGDTRPSLELAKAGISSDILIHEATFSDDLQEEAIDKRHCTISEAVNIGLAMKSRFTLLTHISQRYAKTVPHHQWNYQNILPVSDMMSLSLQKLESLDCPGFIQKMIEILPTEEESEEGNTLQASGS